MKSIVIPTYYYQQFDADYNLDVPAEGFGGWKKTDLELNPERTAVVVMHAWDCGTREEYPGWFNCVEYIPRSYEIMKKVFPKLLNAVRNSELKLYHVVSSEDYCKDYPGYKYASEHAEEEQKYELVETDPVLEKLRKFKFSNVHPGDHNWPDIERGFKKMKFPKEAEPKGEEGIAKNANQLYALCKRDKVNHLIYTGFAINWCLLGSPGGMFDMTKRGIMCSTIRQAVTAVENKETARNGLCKEIALWRVSIAFGYVYDVDDFISAIKHS